MNEEREARVAAAQVRLAEIAQKFIARSRGELATMRECLAKIPQGDAAALADIHHLAHRMSGTSATLGFNALSDCAARIEKLVEASRPGGPVDLPLTKLTGAIDALAAQIDTLAARDSGSSPH